MDGAGQISQARLAEPMDFAIYGTGVRVSDSSSYAGRDGFLRFLACAGIAAAPVLIDPQVLASLEPLWSPALRDLLQLGGYLPAMHRVPSERNRIDRLGSHALHMSYMAYATRGAVDEAYDWTTSASFRHQYFDCFNVDASCLASSAWVPDMVLLNEEASCSLILANPCVRTADGEWEVWRWNHSYPGALRFRSVAHWLAYAMAEALNSWETIHPLSDPELRRGCAKHLFVDPS